MQGALTGGPERHVDLVNQRSQRGQAELLHAAKGDIPAHAAATPAAAPQCVHVPIGAGDQDARARRQRRRARRLVRVRRLPRICIQDWAWVYG